MKYIFLILMAFTSCKNFNNQKAKPDNNVKMLRDTESLASVHDPIKGPISHRQCVDFVFNQEEDASDNFITKLILSFPADFEGVKPADIASIRRVNSHFNVFQFGICDVFAIQLSEDLATVLPRKLTLFINTSLAKAVLFPFEYLQPVKIKAYDSSFLVGGTYVNKSKGYFFIYQFDNRKGFTSIFESASDRYCGNGVPVFNNSTECISYSPFMLAFENDDIDGDGLNDLIFRGKALIFCEGLETGYGKGDRKALKEQQLTIKFKTVVESGALKWELIDTSICKFLSIN